MTDAEFTALTGLAFPLSLDDLPAALDKLRQAGYTARVVDRAGELGLAVDRLTDAEVKEVPCSTIS